MELLATGHVMLLPRLRAFSELSCAGNGSSTCAHRRRLAEMTGRSSPYCLHLHLLGFCAPMPCPMPLSSSWRSITLYDARYSPCTHPPPHYPIFSPHFHCIIFQHTHTRFGEPSFHPPNQVPILSNSRLISCLSFHFVAVSGLPFISPHTLGEDSYYC